MKDGIKGKYRRVDTDIALGIITLIQEEKRTSAAKMAVALETSHSKISRTIKDMREILGVKIKWVPSPLVDDPGWYEINDYGLLNKKKIIKKAGTS